MVRMSKQNGAALGKIERRRAVDDVQAAIRDAILQRRFPPGMRLNVDELAAQLGVSLTPVRSAMQLLSAEGLVDVHSRSGTFVATLTRRDLSETFDIRCALECLAAEQAAAQLTDEHLKRARRQLVILARTILTDEKRTAHEQANTELHQIIIEASGNKRLADVYESLQAHIAMGRLHRADKNWQERIAQEHAEHGQIVAAMEKRDAKALSQALRHHIMRAKSALMASMPDGE